MYSFDYQRPTTRADAAAVALAATPVASAAVTATFNAGSGTQVNFAESIATVQPNLVEVQPTTSAASGPRRSPNREDRR